MNILKKIVAKNNDIYNEKPVTIAFLGDSVTQGCFEVYYKRNGELETVYESEQAFSTKLKRILHYFCPSAQINVINSGLSGDGATNGNNRFERDIAPYKPDLVVVGFALNDCFESTLEEYSKSLENIFNKVKKLGAECIFLTPNIINDKVSPHITDERIVSIAEKFIDNKLDEFVKTAIDTAKNNGVTVCDVYKKWQLLRKYGIDTTELLANKLNHPSREMHWLTAFTLMQTILEEGE